MNTNIARDRKPRDGVRDPCRLIAFAAVGHRCKVRRIRFCEDPVVGNETQQGFVGPFPESHDAAERHVPSGVDGGFRERVRPCVAVHHANDACRPRFGHHRSRILFGVPGMDYDGTPCLARKLQLGRERPPLLHAGGIVVVVVEPALADRDSAGSNMFAKLFHVFPCREADRVVRMNSGRIPYEGGVKGGEAPRRASGAEDIPGAAAGADADDCLGTALLSPPDYIAAVARERGVCEVRVAVDERCDTDVFFGHFL